VIVFQLLSNGVLTGRRIVIYDPAAIIGWRIAYAPVEDLLFGFAMVLLTLSVWVWLGRRGVQRHPAAGEGSRLLARLARATPGGASPQARANPDGAPPPARATPGGASPRRPDRAERPGRPVPGRPRRARRGRPR